MYENMMIYSRSKWLISPSNSSAINFSTWWECRWEFLQQSSFYNFLKIVFQFRWIRLDWSVVVQPLGGASIVSDIWRIESHFNWSGKGILIKGNVNDYFGYWCEAQRVSLRGRREILLERSWDSLWDTIAPRPNEKVIIRQHCQNSSMKSFG